MGDAGYVYALLEEASRQMLTDIRTPVSSLHSLIVDDTAGVNAAMVASATSVDVPLKSDFLRLVTLKVDGWYRAIHAEDVVESESNDVFQRYEDGTLNALSTRPLAALVFTASPATGYADSSLRCYPGSADATPVTTMQYVPVTAPEDVGTSLTEPMVWKAAQLVFQPIDPEISTMCLGQYEAIMASRRAQHSNVATRPYRYL